jgi:hypothetical protein
MTMGKLVMNVIATLAMPPALVFLFLLVNDRRVVGEHVHGRVASGPAAVQSAQ